MMQKSKRRYDQLDYVKALGILIVVWGHVINNIFTENAANAVIERHINSFHMPVFFLAAGITLGIRYNQRAVQTLPLSSYAKERAHRLLLPYLVWSIPYILMNLAAHPQDWKSILSERLWALVTVRGIAPMWFLGALFLGEILWILWVQKSPFQKDRQHGINKDLLMMLLLTLLSWIPYHFIQVESIGARYPIVTIFRTAPILFFIGLGYRMGLRWKNIDRLPGAQKAMATVLCGGAFFLVNALARPDLNMHLYRVPNILLFLLTSCFGSLALLFFCSLLPDRIAVLSHVGRRSLDIMLIHLLLISLLAKAFPGWARGGVLQALFLAILVLIASYFLSVFLDRKIRNRFPFV